MKKIWLKYKLFIVRTLIFAGFFFLIGFYKKYHVPRIKQWLLVEVEAQSRKHLPIRIWPERVDLEAFPIGATFYNIKILPQKDMKKIIEPTEIKSVNVRLGMWALMKGELRIARIKIDGAKLNIHMPETSSGSASEISMKDFDKIPLDKISVSNLVIESFSAPNEITATSANLGLSVERKYNTLRVAIDSEKLKILKAKKTTLFEADFNARFLLDQEGLYVSNIKVSRENSFLIGAGSITGNIFKSQIKEIKTKIRGDLKLEELRPLVIEFVDPTKFPNIAGDAIFESKIEYAPGKPVRSDYSLSTQKLRINQYDINNLELQGNSDEKTFHIENAKIKNNFGEIAIFNGNFNLNENYSFDAKIRGNNLELNSFLTALGLHEVPVYLKLNGDLPCSGQIKNKFSLTCKADLVGQDLSVLTSVKKPFTIVAIKDIKASGSLTVTDKNVSYKADLTVGKSKGESSGTISYAEGFKINYSTPALNFLDISDLSNLKPEGTVELKGSTTGNSKTATFALEATASDMYLYNFYLGRVRTKLDFKKGILHFNKTEAQIGSSRFKGELDIDVNTNTLELHAALPFIDAEDILSAFKRKVELPFKITGTGSATINAHGPLDFTKLSYTLNSSLYRGTIADETFDQIQFNVVSQDGYVQTQQATLSKSRSTISANGKVDPSGNINLVVQGQNFEIEQSENLARLKTNMTGNLNFEMTLTDFILKPNINLIGNVTHAMVGEQASLNSKFKISLNEKFISGDAQLLGQALNLSFNSTYAKDGATELNVKTDNWNIAQTFSIFSESLRSGSYQTNLTSQAHLIIPNQDAYNFSGEFSATSLFLRNGRAEMSIKKPIGLTIKNGIITVNDFEVVGENTYIRLKSEQTMARQLGLTLDGRLDLTLATLLTPFLDDLKGLLKFSFSLNGTYENPIFKGSSFIEDGLVKIKGFPHALEQINADAIFNNENIIINSAKGKIGGGQFSGGGRIEARKLGEMPIDIKGQFYDSKFNVPEGFNTRGSGEFFVRGSWFPYTVGANFNVEQGLIEKRTLESTKSTPDIKPSSYLPKYLSAQRFSPINLALDINIRRPLPVKVSISRVDIRAEASGAMKIFGPPDSPALTGKIIIARGGKITFRSNTFEIKNGSLEYENAEPTNPTLNIQAEARVTAQLKTNETREYDIEMNLQGTANNPKLTLSSQPVLPENDLISLLTLGFINETAAGEDEPGAPLANTGYQMGLAFFNEQLGINRVLESRLGVQFDINASYDSADKAEKHKFTLRKQWTPKFGTAASKELGKTTTNSVKAEYKLNKNLSVIGEWEGKEPTGTEQTTQSEKELNLFGLDIEYRVDFK